MNTYNRDQLGDFVTISIRGGSKIPIFMGSYCASFSPSRVCPFFTFTCVSVFSRIRSFGSFSFASWCLRSTCGHHHHHPHHPHHHHPHHHPHHPHHYPDHLVHHDYNYLKAIISPASKLHDASLLVKGEILNVHLAGGVVDGWWLPLESKFRLNKSYQMTPMPYDTV